ncbi:hypothetical protein [Pseudobdellovibrio sp. HCB154]|uniref:hypothetical protein n=1 Tax=Pseudobdellovibrio sp. HCB154 TaxID=3386277 RepID=UPI003916FB9E
MAAPENTKADLTKITQLLLRVHKSLLQFQKEKYEAQNEKTLSPYDVLHLSMSHEDFDWLKKITSLVVRMDESLDDETTILADLHRSVLTEVHSLFDESEMYADFKSKLMVAQSRDPLLVVQVLELKKFVGTPKLNS